MTTVAPYMTFGGTCEEAFTYYKSVFGGEMLMLRFDQFGDDPGNPMSEQDKQLIAFASLDLGGPEQQLRGDDAPSFMPPLTQGNNAKVMLDVDSPAEVDRLFAALNGGHTMMGPQDTEWAERFAMCADQFGVQWVINFAGNKG